MNLFEKILLLFQTDMPTPLPFGWFHWLWIGITATAIILLYCLKGCYGEKQLKWVLLIYGVIAALAELSKQLAWSFNWDAATQSATWDYQWYAAPFQFCSTPIYVTLAALFLKKCKFRDALLSYLAFVTLIGGCMVIILPDSCFCSDILVNIHTMWLHCGSFVVSVYLLMSDNVSLTKQNWLRACVVFLVFAATALAMNLGVYHSGILGEESFNMFYISPYFESVLPVFVDIQKTAPYPIFLATYIAAIFLGSGLVFWIAKGIKAGVNYCKQRVLRTPAKN